MKVEEKCRDRECCKCGSRPYVGMGDREFCYECFCKIPGVILMVNRALWELKLFTINIAGLLQIGRDESGRRQTV